MALFCLDLSHLSSWMYHFIHKHTLAILADIVHLESAYSLEIGDLNENASTGQTHKSHSSLFLGVVFLPLPVLGHVITGPVREKYVIEFKPFTRMNGEYFDSSWVGGRMGFPSIKRNLSVEGIQSIKLACNLEQGVYIFDKLAWIFLALFGMLFRKLMTACIS